MQKIEQTCFYFLQTALWWWLLQFGIKESKVKAMMGIIQGGWFDRWVEPSLMGCWFLFSYVMSSCKYEQKKITYKKRRFNFFEISPLTIQNKCNHYAKNVLSMHLKLYFKDQAFLQQHVQYETFMGSTQYKNSWLILLGKLVKKIQKWQCPTRPIINLHKSISTCDHFY